MQTLKSNILTAANKAISTKRVNVNKKHNMVWFTPKIELNEGEKEAYID